MATPDSDEFHTMVTQTIKLQRSIAEALDLTVDILHGPNEELREEALVKLSQLADTMRDSASRLAELNA